MKSCGILGILLYAVCVQLSALAATDNGPFKSYPTMTALPVGVRITFEVAQPADVEISVLDAGDRVIRHLAAGVLDSAPKTVAPSGGPMCWAVSLNGSSLYFTGWWNARQTEGVRDDGVLWRVDPASGKATQLLKIDTSADSPVPTCRKLVEVGTQSLYHGR